MESKYRKNQLVEISKIFVIRGANLVKEKCDPIVAYVKSVRKTPSLGYCYELEFAGKTETAQVCYWEDDIDGSIQEDPDFIWRIWGDQ